MSFLLLVIAWLAGRLIMAPVFALPVWLVISVDMLFPLLLLGFVGREIVLGGSARNYPIVAIIGMMAVLNLLFHFGRIGITFGEGRVALYLLLHLVLLLVTVIGGRIIPNFTAGWLRHEGRGSERMPVSYAGLELVVVLTTLLTGVASAYAPFNAFFAEYLGLFALLAGLAHGLRLLFWRGLATRSNPLLFVLHVAYMWLPVGYLLTAMSEYGLWFSPTIALHALTMGVIGLMILAVTPRVALGHTGRPLHVSRAVVVAYALLTVAVLVRLSGAFLPNYLMTIDLSATAWIAAFAIFVWVYWPVLIKPSVK